MKRWLLNSRAARTALIPDPATEPDLAALTEQNVLLQLAHLQTHPAVRDGVARGDLTLLGWVYDIATGDVRVHNASSGRFESTISADQQASRA